jgi:transposase-like protein
MRRVANATYAKCVAENTRQCRREVGYAETKRQEALRLYVDGMNQRRIARTLDVSHQTVANWIKAHADSLPNLPPEVPELTLEVNELDELFTFVADKKTESSS